MSIRLMTKEDLERVCELEKQLFLFPWSLDDFEYELDKNPFSKYYVSIKDNKIVSYIGLWMIGDQCQVTTVGVDKDYQGQGLASELLNLAIQESKDLHYSNVNLEVRVSNEQAIRLYEHKGFKIVTLRKDYYQNHEDAYLMIKELEG